jgi:hypothetical protein
VRDGGALLVAGSGLVAPLAGNHVSLPQSSMIAARGRAFIAPSLAAFGVRRYDAGGIERLVARKTDTVLLRDGRGVVALRYPLGRGSVIDVVDGSLFRNGSIARYDRARLAVALAALLARRPETRIAFDEAIHGYAAPLHWWLVLPRPFVFAVAAGALVLAVALAGAALRLGPARAAEPERAPTSEEYLDALAALMQKAHAGRASLQQASVSTHRLLGRHAAGDHAGETVGALDALAAQTHPTDRDVIRGLELAHAVRKEYAGRERRR